MKAIEINHVSEYLNWTEETTKGYGRSHLFLFRGMPNKQYSLIPSVFRKKNDGGLIHEIYLEHNSEAGIVQAFKTKAASLIHSFPIDEDFTWVEYAQHFGAPTRLLDWTENPLVALYFACISDEEEDGIVYILQPELYYQISFGKNNMDGKTIKKEAAKMIWKKEKSFPYPIAFRPYYIDQRMNAQSSWLMVWGYKIDPLEEIIPELEKNGKGKVEYTWEEDDGSYSTGLKEETALESIIILKKSKDKLLYELNRIGINHATLFPGLDGIGKVIEWQNRSKHSRLFDLP